MHEHVFKVAFMKILIAIVLAATLSGCIIIPAGGGGHRHWHHDCCYAPH
jgi:hypothetical protein